MHSVVQLTNECRITCMTKVHRAFIEQILLAATTAASAKALISPAACYAGVHALAESVHQNCVLGRCANLCFIVVLQTSELNSIYDIKVKQKMLNNRTAFFEDYGKNNKFFYDECKQYCTNNTIQELELDNGTILDKITGILHEQKKFYEKLYSAKTLIQTCYMKLNMKRNFPPIT